MPVEPANNPGPGRPIFDPRGAAAVPVTWLLVVATLIACIPTVLDPDVLRGPAVMNGSARGTALVMALAVVPLVAAMLVAVRGSARALAVWLGMAAYLAYNGVMLLWGTPFNVLFLAYVATLGLSIWTVVTVLYRVDVARYAERAGAVRGRRPIAVFIWTVAALNAAAWLRGIVPGMLADGEPAFLEGTGLVTLPTYVQDLAFWLPLCAVAAWWLWAGRPWGFVLAPAMLLFYAVEGVGVAVDQWWGHAADPGSTVVSPQVGPVFLVVSAACACLAWHLLRPLRPAR